MILVGSQISCPLVRVQRGVKFNSHCVGAGNVKQATRLCFCHIQGGERAGATDTSSNHGGSFIALGTRFVPNSKQTRERQW